MKALSVIAAASLALAAGAVQASAELAKKAGCTAACHDVSTKKVGPSFKSVAEKHKGDEAKILAALNDKKHPPIKASDDDKKALAKWIAAQK